MIPYLQMTKEQLQDELARLQRDYAKFKAMGLKLNMARGKPSVEQCNLSNPMLDVLNSESDMNAEDGTYCCNYGVLEGLPETRRLMGAMLDAKPENVLVGGNASLPLMYDAISRYMMFGPLGATPWSQVEGGIKWLCPVPGYDRHFAITEAFGIEMIPVKMDENGPDMDEVERLVAADDHIKGIWCVPKYSNPSGITYSDEVVIRLARMETAAEDFRIFWDNAYTVHHLYDEPENQDVLFDLADECIRAGHPHRFLKFASTSKVTFPGAGIAAMSAHPDNINEIKRWMSIQIIGYDKLNQLRHARFLQDADGIAAHMAKHAAILRPKFELVAQKLKAAFEGNDFVSWTNPRGGYFVSFDAFPGTAKKVVALAKEAGVVMTGAGATWPHGIDPNDSNIRIAPTLPPIEELEVAMDVFTCCVKLAAVEKLLNE